MRSEKHPIDGFRHLHVFSLVSFVRGAADSKTRIQKIHTPSWEALLGGHGSLGGYVLVSSLFVSTETQKSSAGSNEWGLQLRKSFYQRRGWGRNAAGWFLYVYVHSPLWALVVFWELKWSLFVSLFMPRGLLCDDCVVSDNCSSITRHIWYHRVISVPKWLAFRGVDEASEKATLRSFFCSSTTRRNKTVFDFWHGLRISFSQPGCQVVYINWYRDWT